MIKKIFITIAILTYSLLFVISASTISSVASTTFMVSFDSGNICTIVRETYQTNFPGINFGASYWISSTGSLTNSTNDCFRADGVDSNNESKTTCCPDRQVCDTEGSVNRCVPETKISCSEFMTESECNSADSNIAYNELESIAKTVFLGGCDFRENYATLGCFIYLDCGCKWNSQNNTCGAYTNQKIKKINPTDGTSKVWDYSSNPLGVDVSNNCEVLAAAQSDLYDGETYGHCTLTPVFDGKCDGEREFVTRTWTVVYQSGADLLKGKLTYCQKPFSDTYQCPKVIKLSFFDWLNLLIVVILLIIIYYAVHNRNSAARKKKRK